MRRVQGAIFNIDPSDAERRWIRAQPSRSATVRRWAYLSLAGQRNARLYPVKVHDFMKEGLWPRPCRCGAQSVRAGHRARSAMRMAYLCNCPRACNQNLMIEMAIEAAGGKVFAAPDWQSAFAEAGGASPAFSG